MNTGTYPRPGIFTRSANSKAELVGQSATLAGVRAAGNIELWQSYLPENCVDTMIKMGWDQTT
jgi:hypothetical protein